jgi:hypothetical protein
MFILLSSLYSKQCYINKYGKVCYFKYFDRKSIYKAKSTEDYYITRAKKIYAFNDKIEVKFKTFGAILTILNDFEIDFLDKEKETYIFKVRYSSELFSIISRLNKLDIVKKAVPSRVRKKLKIEVYRKIEAERKRLSNVLEKSANDEEKNKSKKNVFKQDKNETVF